MIHVAQKTLNRKIKEEKTSGNDLPKTMTLPCEFCRILSTWIGTVGNATENKFNFSFENSPSVETILTPKNEENSTKTKPLVQNLLKRQRPYCDECGKSFFDKGNFNRHIRIVHQGLKADKVKCDYCGNFYCNNYT